MEALPEAGGYVVLPKSTIEVILKSLRPASRDFDEFDPIQLREDFLMCCAVDLRLSKRTIEEHARHLERFLNFLENRHPLSLTTRDLREFLIKNPARNAIKFLRVFYGKFLKSNLASGFKIPQSPSRVVLLPTRWQLTMTFCNLKTIEFKAAFLLLATSGLRRGELCALTLNQISFGSRMIIPAQKPRSTKNTWVTFFNDEAETWLKRWIEESGVRPDERIFAQHNHTYTKWFKRASYPYGFVITPQILRCWFAEEMGRLGVAERYIDAFCGRVPKSVLARHYTDLSAHNLHQIYVKAGLKVRWNVLGIY